MNKLAEVMKEAEPLSPHGYSAHLNLKDRLLHLLAQGPMATSTLCKIITMEDHGLKDPAQLTMEPYRTAYKKTRTRILNALNRLEKQKRVIGEDLLVGQGPEVAIQIRWWRLPTRKEWHTGRVDKALSRRLAQRIWPQVKPSLKRMEHWQTLLKVTPAA